MDDLELDGHEVQCSSNLVLAHHQIALGAMERGNSGIFHTDARDALVDLTDRRAAWARSRIVQSLIRTLSLCTHSCSAPSECSLLMRHNDFPCIDRTDLSCEAQLRRPPIDPKFSGRISLDQDSGFQAHRALR